MLNTFMNSLSIRSKSWLTWIRRKKRKVPYKKGIEGGRFNNFTKSEQDQKSIVSRKEPIFVGVWRKPFEERFPQATEIWCKVARS